MRENAQRGTPLEEFDSKGGIWSRDQIERQWTDDLKRFGDGFDKHPGRLYIRPFNPANLEPCSYDLRVGRTALSLSRVKKDFGKITRLNLDGSRVEDLRSSKALINVERGGITINPKECWIIWTMEEIAVPMSVCAIVTTKVNLAGQGLIQVTSRIDPGFGKDHPRSLQIPLFNASTRSVSIDFGMNFSNVLFISLQQPPSKGYDAGPSAPIRSYDFFPRKKLEKMSFEDLVDEIEGLGPGFDAIAAALRELHKAKIG